MADHHAQTAAIGGGMSPIEAGGADAALSAGDRGPKRYLRTDTA
jgi:hypothetical protein